jgi:KipI family sensor histidine kinase inhibitor
MSVMRLRPVGGSALLIECRDAEHVEAWRTELWRRRGAGELEVVDIVPGARTVLLDGVGAGAAELVSAWPEPMVGQGGDGPLIEIPATFDGEDLDDVASRWGVPSGEAAERLTATPLAVAFCGFAPGFAYLRGLPEEWAVPRLDSPRPRVPAGAIGIAGAYVGIYPTASPGGWRLVGHTDQNLFDVRREPPAVLTPGARVRLVAS